MILETLFLELWPWLINISVGNSCRDTPGEFDDQLKELAARTPFEAEPFIEKMDFANALSTIWGMVGRANKYIDETSLDSGKIPKERLGTVLYNL